MSLPQAISSLDPLPDNIRNGMIAMGLLGILSTFSTGALLIFITYRMVYWRQYYDHSIAKNQIFILIYNLLLADFQQALSFLFAWHWIAQDKLVGPNKACFAQAWLIQIGDVSSGLWVLAIALHTFTNLVIQRRVPMPVFLAGVLSTWIFALLLTIMGPALHDAYFFVPSGAWCWINSDHEKDRLYLHYVWIFIAELGSLVIYAATFAHLRLRIASSQIFHQADTSLASTNNDTDFGTKTGPNNGTVTVIVSQTTTRDAFVVSRQRILRTARYMVVYPIAYIALTLPLAAGRVASMAGNAPSITYFPIAGTLIASSGVVDVLLYIYTRKALVKSSVGLKNSDRNSRIAPRLQTMNPANRTSVMMNDLDKDGIDDAENGMRPDRIIVSKSVTTVSHDPHDPMSSEDSSRIGGMDGSESIRSTESKRSLVDQMGQTSDRTRRMASKDLKFWHGSNSASNSRGASNSRK